MKGWLKKGRKGTFGTAVQYDLPKYKVPTFKTAGEPNLVIVCYNIGGGLRPVRLLLPHQVYKENYKDIIKEWGNSHFFEIVLVPARSSEYIKVYGDIPKKVLK